MPPKIEFLAEHETYLYKCPSIYGGMGGPVSCPPPPPPPPPPAPAEPHLVASPGAPTPVIGSMWVDGALLHYIASDNKDYGETGASQPAAPGAVHGSIWVDGEDVHYIDSSGTHRTISKTSLGAKPAPAIQGSMYLEANSPAAPGRDIRWVGGTNYYRWWNGS